MKTLRYLLIILLSACLLPGCGDGEIIDEEGNGKEEEEEVVKDDKPAWNAPKVETFEYSMTYVTQISFEGKLTTNTATEIAAFLGEECRGKATIKYEASLKLYLCYLTIVSNTVSGEKITLSVFDPDKSILYKNATTIDFSNNQTLGSMDSILECKK